MNPTTNPPDPIATDVLLIGGKTLTAHHRDGKAEQVVVRLARVRELPTLIGLLDDEPGLIEHLTNRPAKWADTLTPESHVELLEAALELNRPTLAGFIARRTETAKWGAGVVAPLVKQIEGLQSLGGAHKPGSPSA